MQPGKLMVRAVHRSTTLHLVAELVAVTAGEEAPGTVELRDSPAAIHSISPDIADEPGPHTAEPAGGPLDRHALLNHLPIVGARLDAVIQGDGVPVPHNLDGARSAAAVAPLDAAGTWPRQKAGAREPHHVKRPRSLPTVPAPFQLCPPRDIRFRLPKFPA